MKRFLHESDDFRDYSNAKHSIEIRTRPMLSSPLKRKHDDDDEIFGLRRKKLPNLGVMRLKKLSMSTVIRPPFLVPDSWRLVSADVGATSSNVESASNVSVLSLLVCDLVIRVCGVECSLKIGPQFPLGPQDQLGPQHYFGFIWAGTDAKPPKKSNSDSSTEYSTYKIGCTVNYILKHYINRGTGSVCVREGYNLNVLRVQSWKYMGFRFNLKSIVIAEEGNGRFASFWIREKGSRVIGCGSRVQKQGDGLKARSCKGRGHP
ncbi:hypothetical protein ISN44_As10g012100 [Arabidopsis suecica]|uniref:Uncharacterized protein n=1 Tax=Arabidopsis suecica TaxID=45249 RepID=A0A8T1ZWS6_ARASU|nr:hypothetical protein ISN44_As10g012100 [Arabidopsis suecica]